MYKTETAEVSFNIEMVLLSLTILMFFAVWFFVKNTYVNKGKLPLAEYIGWEKLSANKLYIDEIYNAVFVKSVEGLGRFFKVVDKKVVDNAVELIGCTTEESGKTMKKIQNGNVENYVLIMALAVGIIILIVNFI